MKHKKKYVGFLMSKVWQISLELFVKHKPSNCEECMYTQVYLFTKLKVLQNFQKF